MNINISICKHQYEHHYQYQHLQTSIWTSIWTSANINMNININICKHQYEHQYQHLQTSIWTSTNINISICKHQYEHQYEHLQTCSNLWSTPSSWQPLATYVYLVFLGVARFYWVDQLDLFGLEIRLFHLTSLQKYNLHPCGEID